MTRRSRSRGPLPPATGDVFSPQPVFRRSEHESIGSSRSDTAWRAGKALTLEGVRSRSTCWIALKTAEQRQCHPVCLPGIIQHTEQHRIYRGRVRHRVLRLRMVAVKNSMKRRLTRSPRARIIAGRASRPARMSVSGGFYLMSSRIGAFGIGSAPPVYQI
jgi:hypothetical protein